jgi:hypothetical protein
MDVEIAIRHVPIYPTARRGENRNGRGKPGTGPGLWPKSTIRDPIRSADPTSLPLRTSQHGWSVKQEAMPPMPMDCRFSDPQAVGDERLIMLIPVLHTFNDSYNLL